MQDELVSQPFKLPPKEVEARAAERLRLSEMALVLELWNSVQQRYHQLRYRQFRGRD